MQLVSQRIFVTELKRLRQLALTSTYSFDLIRKSLTELSKVSKPSKGTRITVNDSSGETLDFFQVLNRLKSQAPRYLLELLFTRVISALEIFLIDSIKEIGKIAPEKFMSEEQITLTRNQIFSFSSLDSLRESLIIKDCRQLSSAGFQEITKFYKNKLNINYNSLKPGISKIEEYHERRHLLIHRLGEVDENYTHKYSTDVKRLSVDIAYLLNAINDFTDFSAELNAKIFIELFQIPMPVKENMNRRLFVFEIMSPYVLPECLEPTFLIKRTDGSVSLEDISLERHLKKNRMRLIIESDPDSTDLFSKLIKKAHMERKIELIFTNPKKIHKPLLRNNT